MDFRYRGKYAWAEGLEQWLSAKRKPAPALLRVDPLPRFRVTAARIVKNAATLIERERQLSALPPIDQQLARAELDMETSWFETPDMGLH